MLYTLAPLILSFVISMLIIPDIIKISIAKGLTDLPDGKRKLHSSGVPTTGGLAIFAATLGTYSFLGDYLFEFKDIKFLSFSLIALLLVGLKDDLVHISAFKKLSLQILCAGVITIFGQLYLTSLWGMFGIVEISPVIGVVITIATIVGLINAFNLIDGVNGLSSGLGLISALVFGVWFYLSGLMSLSVLSFSLAGAVAGFLVFNYPRGLIFMGDTGAMILGFIVAVLAIKFIEANRIPAIETSRYYVKAAPAFAVGVILIPILDMIRVFVERILAKKGPFVADRRHLHHLMIDVGISGPMVTLTILLFQMVTIALALMLKESRSLWVVSFLVIPYILICTFLKYRKLKSK